MGDSDKVVAVIAKIRRACETARAEDAAPSKSKSKKGAKRQEDHKFNESELTIGLAPFVSIETYASENGLTTDEMLQVVDLLSLPLGRAEQEKLTDRLAHRLVHCMIPRGVVADEVILQVFGFFSSLSHPIQAEVLKWVLIIYELLENEAAILSKLYVTFYHYLRWDSLRLWCVMILFRITRASDVSQWQVDELLHLITHADEFQSHLIALLHLFHELCPRLSVNVPPLTKKAVVMYQTPDVEFAEKIHRVQKKVKKRRMATTDVDEVTETKSAKKLAKETTGGSLPSLRTATRTHDNIVTAYAQVFLKKVHLSDQLAPALIGVPSNADNWAHHLTASEVKQKKEAQKYFLAQNAEMSTVSKPNPTQFLIGCYPHPSYLIRVEHWIAAVLEDDPIRHWGSNTKESQTLFRSLAQTAEFFGELLPSVQKFLLSYIKSAWNGFYHRNEVLRLMQYLYPIPYGELYTAVLKPLLKIFRWSDPAMKADILNSYTLLLKRWFHIDWKTFFENKGSKLFLFCELATDVDHYQTISEFIRFVDQLCVQGLALENNDPLLQYATAEFYYLVSRMASEYRMPFTSPPSPELIYRSLFSSNAFAISNMCEIMVQYKFELDYLKKAPPDPNLRFKDGTESIGALNGYITDFSDSLWRHKIFTPGHKSFGLNPQIIQSLKISDLPQILSVTHSLAFVHFAYSFLNDESNTQLIDSQQLSSVKDAIRVSFIDSLQKDSSLDGLHKFLHTFIGTLVKRKQQLGSQ